jgi:hypothetical protein
MPKAFQTFPQSTEEKDGDEYVSSINGDYTIGNKSLVANDQSLSPHYV